VALLGAARRAAAHDLETALAVLAAANSPTDIAHGESRAHQRLRAYRTEVHAETERCFVAAPRFANQFALVRIRSAAYVHPVVAARWAQRLERYVVIVANDGYLPGRVHVAVHSKRGDDLVALLRGTEIGIHVSELGHGHAHGSGGVLAPGELERLVLALGFAEN
jgi:single-stranded-DNA-specific exonuclease